MYFPSGTAIRWVSWVLWAVRHETYDSNVVEAKRPVLGRYAHAAPACFIFTLLGGTTDLFATIESLRIG